MSFYLYSCFHSFFLFHPYLFPTPCPSSFDRFLLRSFSWLQNYNFPASAFNVLILCYMHTASCPSFKFYSGMAQNFDINWSCVLKVTTYIKFCCPLEFAWRDFKTIWRLSIWRSMWCHTCLIWEAQVGRHLWVQV